MTREKTAIHRVALALCGDLLAGVRGTVDSSQFDGWLLDELRRAVPGRWCLATLRDSEWKVSPDAAWVDPRCLGDALDGEQEIEYGGSVYIPIPADDFGGLPAAVLVVRDGPSDALPREVVTALRCTIAAARVLVELPARSTQRSDVLQRVLDAVRSWSVHRDMERLLVDLAEAATHVLKAERASVFLWDRTRRQLVARPALGVEGDELVIPDDRGVVGEVVQNVAPRFVHADATQAIDRDVDQRLKFRTRNLICVPLVGVQGECIGAFEVLNKRSGDFDNADMRMLDELARHAAMAVTTAQDRERLFVSRRQIADEAAERVQLIGTSRPMESLRATVGRVADTDLAVLITGENGTGKEVVSQMVHYLSSRRDEPFVAVNCAAIAETLLESELFGHEKGAFTDAREARAGKFELASGGTLFLDEIGDLSLGGQAKLLRVLEEKVVVRVGGSQAIPTDARVLAATNQDLAAMVREQTFREDLFFRLNVVTLHMPPLRERVDDIPVLANHFLKIFSMKARRKPPVFTAAAVKQMRRHAWPGNVRELRNLMERLAYLTSSEKIDVDDLSFVLSPAGASGLHMSMELGLTEATRAFQIQYIQRHIRDTGGSMTEAARRLGMHRSNLYRKMRQLGMETGEEQDASDTTA